LFLAGLILLIALSLSRKSSSDYEKASPFECGFIIQTKARHSVSVHFFLLTVIFLVFDVELILLFPIFLTPYSAQLALWGFLALLFLLVVGIFYEWGLRTLEWVDFL